MTTLPLLRPSLPPPTMPWISSCLQATGSQRGPPLDLLMFPLLGLVFENLCLLYRRPAVTPTSLPILESSLSASTVSPASSCRGLSLGQRLCSHLAPSRWQVAVYRYICNVVYRIF